MSSVEESATSTPTLLSTSIVAVGSNESLFELVMPVGTTRSNSGVLLMPGEYQVIVSAITSDGNPMESSVAYSLDGLVLSDPLAIELDDGAGQPFACPAAGGALEFCYPGTTTGTTDPFVWEGPTTTVETIDVDAGTISTWREADWWNWYWAAEGTGEPPVASPDNYQTSGQGVLSVGTENGLLSNDNDAEGDVLAVVLTSETRHGDVDVELDGSFVYQPGEGFVGVDQFTYQVTDFGGFSDDRTVTIEVFSGGDLDHGHIIDDADIDLLAAAIRGSIEGDRFDLNADGAVTLDDQSILLSLIGVLPGDANLDGVVDTVDFAAWNNNAFTSPTGWRTGDFNADGFTDGSDFNIWSNHQFEQQACLLYTSPSPRDATLSRMPSSA